MPGFTSKSFQTDTPPPRDIDERRPQASDKGPVISDEEKRETQKQKFALALKEGSPGSDPYGILTVEDRIEVVKQVFGDPYTSPQSRSLIAAIEAGEVE